MFRETVTMDKHDNEVLAMKLQNGDLSGVKMTGEITDRIFKNGVLVEERHGHNLVVNSFLRLVMCLLKKQSGYTGIQYWAVGSGAASWDGSMPTPDINATQLTAELGRVAIPASEIVFLDSNYDETLTPTNIIQVKHVFGTADCNGVWREFGLFGGNATSNANSGILINKRHHAVLTKTNEMTVERTMRFTLSLV
jgi:hypothetical protein